MEQSMLNIYTEYTQNIDTLVGDKYTEIHSSNSQAMG